MQKQPTRYLALQIPLNDVHIDDSEHSCRVIINEETLKDYTVSVNYSLALRMAFKVSSVHGNDDTPKRNRLVTHFVFVDCGNLTKEKKKKVASICEYGVTLVFEWTAMPDVTNPFPLAAEHQHYVLTDRAASMTRQGRLAMIRSDIASEYEKRMNMDIDLAQPMVISKFCAYKGLVWSSVFPLEEERLNYG